MPRKPTGPDGGGDLPYFPDLIETGGDTPILLTPLLITGFTQSPAATGLRIVGIDGTAIAPAMPTELPGIRVGADAGCGYVLRRALDCELVFVPDLDYQGVASFTYTIADDAGEKATIVATVSVHSAAELPPPLSFADGTQAVSVSEGMVSTILGALDIGYPDSGVDADIHVFEQGGEALSKRFVVANGKLVLIEPLAIEKDGDKIVLNIVALSGDTLLAEGEIAVALRPVRSTVSPSTAAATGISLIDASSAHDHFIFNEGQSDASLTSEASPLVDDASRGHAIDHQEEGITSSRPLGLDVDPELRPNSTVDDFGGL